MASPRTSSSIYLSTDGGLTWGIWTAWQASGVKTWTPPQACDCRVKVWARSAGVTTDAAQAEAQLAYVINTPPPAAVTSATLTSNVASPQNTGTAMTFTAGAAGGVNPVQYKLLRADGGGVAQMVRDWSATAIYAWTPSTAASYTVKVWARSAGVTTDAAQAAAQLAYVINTPPPAAVTSATLTSNVASPQNTGTTITLTATAQGGVAPYQFKYYLSTDGGLTWGIWTAWQASGVKTWTPPQACDCRVKVWARSAGVTTDAAQAEAQMAYVINTPPPAAVTSATLGASLASPQNTGTAVTFTAGAAGGVDPVQYKFFVQQGGGVAQMVRDWSTTATLRLDAEHGGQLHGDGVGAQRGCHDRCGAGLGAAGVCDHHTAAGGGDERDADVQCREPAEHGHDDHAHGDGAGWRRPVPVQVLPLDRRRSDVGHLDRVGGLRRQDLDPAAGLQLSRQGVGAQRGCHDRCGAGRGAAGVCDHHTAAGGGDERDADVQCREPAEHGHGYDVHGGGGGWRRPVRVQVFRAPRAVGASADGARWSTTAQYTWTPPHGRQLTVKVWARSAGVTTDAAQAAAQLAYVITTPPPAAVTSATLTSNVASPQNTGTAVSFTAGGGRWRRPAPIQVLRTTRVVAAMRWGIWTLEARRRPRRGRRRPQASNVGEGVGAQRGCHDRCGAGRGAAWRM